MRDFDFLDERTDWAGICPWCEGEADENDDCLNGCDGEERTDEYFPPVLK